MVLVVLASSVAWSSTAEARRRGIVIVTWGETIEHVRDLPADVAYELESETGETLSVGYAYESFGMFWLDIWTWGGRYVLKTGDGYYELSADELAAMAGVDSVGDMGKP
jgi:hypothetical protein